MLFTRCRGLNKSTNNLCVISKSRAKRAQETHVLQLVKTDKSASEMSLLVQIKRLISCGKLKYGVKIGEAAMQQHTDKMNSDITAIRLPNTPLDKLSHLVW